jgi:hypothetical protein
VQDVATLAGLLKAFFRDLKEPVMTTDLHAQWLEIGTGKEPDEIVFQVKRLLALLPVVHYCTLERLFFLLYQV